MSKPLRVCLLGQPSPFNWWTHYLRAFQRRAEVVTVGSIPDEATLERWGKAHLAHLIERPTVTADLTRLASLYDILPKGFEPHLVVSVTGGGVGTFKNTHDLACPTVFLSVDTWQCLTDYEEARHYDVVFTAQKQFVRHLHAAGSRHVFWLPVACDPERHYPVNAQKTFDFSFVGSINRDIHEERRWLLNLLSGSFSVYSLESVYGDEYCKAIAAGRLTFNHSAVQDVNMRVFEAMAMGVPLLTNRDSAVNGLLDLFDDGKHLIVYNGEHDVVETTRRYLEDNASRIAIGEAGRVEVLAKHTYDHRVDQILGTVAELDGRLGEDTRQREVQYDHFKNYLPRIPGLVADLGLEVEASKYALRRLGVTHFVGYSRDNAKKAARSGSYDAIVSAPSEVGSPADTLILSNAIELGDSFGVSVSAAYSLLSEGGTLIARFDAETASREGITGVNITLENWLRLHDFHLTEAHECGNNWIYFSARKRTRRLRDIVYEVYTGLRLSRAPADVLADMIPEDF